jgi:hypothetical protein
MKGKNVHYAHPLIQEIPYFEQKGEREYFDQTREKDTDLTDAIFIQHDNNDDNDNENDTQQTDDTIETSQSDILHKMNLMVFSNGWNDKNEQIVISIGENAASYKWMHEQCANEYTLIDSIVSILTIILITGLSAEITLLNNGTELWIITLKQIIIYLVNVLTIVQNFLRYQELSQRHTSAANDFAELYHNIQQQMCMYRRDRLQAIMYVSECLRKYDSFILKNPDINPRVIKEFKKTFKDVSLPDIIDKIQKIEIITEPKIITKKHKGIHKSKRDNPQDNDKTRSISSIMSLDEMPFKHPSNAKRNSNLSQIHNAFKIQGDITDEELKSMNPNELKQLKQLFLDKKSDYEYQRFIQHTRETD